MGAPDNGSWLAELSGGHALESCCRVRVPDAPGAPVNPLMPRTLEADLPETEWLFEAGVRVKGSVVVVADWVTLRAAVLGVGVEPFRQLPSLLGRQLEHRFPAFAQAPPLHEPVLLHLQHRAITQPPCGCRRTHCVTILRNKFSATCTVR